MEANELRIGNWIYDADDAPHYFQVEEIKKEKGFSGLAVVYRNGSFKVAEPEPILLTEEILLKCGFKEAYRSTFRVRYDHKDFMFIGYDINLSGIDNTATGLRYYGSNIKVGYLHDLQNAFKVFTGEELIYTP